MALLRNTQSGLVADLPVRFLDHPDLGKVLELARTEKPVVLGRPRLPEDKAGASTKNTTNKKVDDE